MEARIKLEKNINDNLKNIIKNIIKIKQKEINQEVTKI